MNHQHEILHPASRPAALDLAAAYSELQDLLLDAPDVAGFLQQLAELSAALVPGPRAG